MLALPALTPSTIADRRAYMRRDMIRSRREELDDIGLLDRRGRCIPSGETIEMPALSRLPVQLRMFQEV